MILNKDYKYRDDLVSKPEDTVPIELLMSPFTGLVYRYDRVHIKEDEEQTHAKMNFDFTVLEAKGFDPEKLKTNKTFNQTLGLILNAMILEFVDSAEPKSGSGNTQEPAEVR